jgi:hypothetical protein
MKKYFLGILAVLLALVFSAFTGIRKKPNATVLYWFQISNQYTPGQAVAQADATFMLQSTTAPLGTGCTGSTYDCVAGFDATQINSSNQLKDDSEVPIDVAYEKN